MAKPRNTEERTRIEKLAFRILTDKGVSSTSFADIADRAGVTRSLVQHYFPKKDIFIEDFINLALNEVSDIVENCEYINQENPVERLYAVGYVEFFFLIYNHQMENLKHDILQNRDNTTMIINDVIRWTLDYLADESNEFKDKIADAIRFAMGGACEYIYACLEDGTEIDVEYVGDKVIASMQAFLGLAWSSVSLPDKLPRSWLEQTAKQLNKTLLG